MAIGTNPCPIKRSDGGAVGEKLYSPARAGQKLPAYAEASAGRRLQKTKGCHQRQPLFEEVPSGRLRETLRTARDSNPCPTKRSDGGAVGEKL